METPFDILLNQAADLKNEILQLEGRKKLTPQAFIDLALRYAEIDASGLDVIRNRLSESDNASEVWGFVRRLASALREPSYPCPPPPDRAGKMMRCYGTAELEGQLAQLEISPTRAIALAAGYAVQKYPEAFGEIPDYELHRAELDHLGVDLATKLGQLNGAWGVSDIVIEHETLPESDRRKGLSRICFRRAPDLNPAVPGWAVLIVDRIAAERLGVEPTPDPTPTSDPAPEVKTKRIIKRRRVPEGLASPRGITGTA